MALHQNVPSGKHVREMYTPLNPTSIYRKIGVGSGIPIFLISDTKHRLNKKKKKNIQILAEMFQILQH